MKNSCCGKLRCQRRNKASAVRNEYVTLLVPVINHVIRLSTFDFVPAFGLHRISLVCDSRKSFRILFLDVLVDKRDACFLGVLFCRRSFLLGPAAPRLDPPVVCPSFGFDRYNYILQVHSRSHLQYGHHLRRQLHRRPFHLPVDCLQALRVSAVRSGDGVLRHGIRIHHLFSESAYGSQ